jgi:hypothetical protein
MYAELAFVRPDGSLHRTLAFVDLGSPSMTVTSALFEELQLDRNTPMEFRVGDLAVRADASSVTRDTEKPYSVGSPQLVEALLPAGILKNYGVVIDYQRRTLALAEPGVLKPDGVPVPARVNDRTGLVTVESSIGGRTYPTAIDNGSAYTWLRKRTVEGWLQTHPGWQRGIGAVGVSNMRMADDGSEADAILARIPEMKLAGLLLQNVGVLGLGPGKEFRNGLDFFDWYSKKSAVPVIGWIGANVVKNYCLTIDYPHRMTYWLKQSELDPHEIDQVGVTLKATGGSYFVAAVATQNGKPTVDGVLAGDKLLKIDGLSTSTATWGSIFSALHGAPGESRSLILERGGRQLTVITKVTAF